MKIKHRLLPMLLLFYPLLLLAQLPYTQKQYQVSVESNIQYGIATTFAGGNEILQLDLYKPIGDNNCQRPLLVMVHGGGFITGTKNDVDVVQISEEMAARGYVVASVNYRLGVHPLSFYEPYAFCNDWLNPIGINKCIYATDSLEIKRALYRATQDVKSAIRFLKGRHELDSTDANNVFVGGSSAGAITALNVVLMDLPNEKPSYAGAQTDALTPDADLASCVPAPADKSRPDLGPVDGEGNQNGHDARVQGVAAFMGGTFDIMLLDDIHLPAIYLYHRTDDLVVPSNTAPLFMLYPYCLDPINLCQPLTTRPAISGSASILTGLGGLGANAPPIFNDILTSYGTADDDDCFDNPPGHSIDDIPLRCENLSGFFASIIAENGNAPTGNCVSKTSMIQHEKRLDIYPNPVKGGIVHVYCKDCPDLAHFRLLDTAGRVVSEADAAPQNFTLNLNNVPSGLYFLQVYSAKNSEVRRIIFE